MANSVDTDQTDENGKQSRPWLYYLERMAKSVDPDQTAENGKQGKPW